MHFTDLKTVPVGDIVAKNYHAADVFRESMASISAAADTKLSNPSHQKREFLLMMLPKSSFRFWSHPQQVQKTTAAGHRHF